MLGLEQDAAAALSGSLVGMVLGLIGGGGSIIAVPLLLYVVGMASPHAAIGTSAIAVSLSGLFNLIAYARRGLVKWPCALTFSAAGMVGAWAGSALAMRMPADHLLALFGILMIAVGAMMALRRDSEGDPDIRLTAATAQQLLPLLLSIGFGVGLLSGFFGIGGGFLIVPGLILATGMPISYAVGTSLAAVTAFGATTSASYAFMGWVDWRVAAFFVAGGMIGGLLGIAASRKLAAHRSALALAFAAFVVLIGGYVTWRGVGPLLA